MVKTVLIDSNTAGFIHIHELLKSNPKLEYVFFHDAQINSIHQKDRLLRRIKKDVRFLMSKGARQIILIDSKICSLILDDLRKAFPEVKFIDSVSLIVQKIVSLDKNKILILGDEQTVTQCRYKNELKKYNEKLMVGQKSCSPLETMIEEVNDPFFIHNYLESALSMLKEKADLAVLVNSAYVPYKRIFETILKCPVYTGENLLDPFLFEKSEDSLQQFCFTTSDPNLMKLKIRDHFNQDIIAEKALID